MAIISLNQKFPDVGRNSKGQLIGGFKSITVNSYGGLENICAQLVTGEEDEDNHGELIQTQAIALGSNNVAYAFGSMYWNRERTQLIGTASGGLIQRENEGTANFRNGRYQLVTVEQRLEEIRSEHNLPANTDFAIFGYYGNGVYSQS